MCIILHISACSKISKIFLKETTEEVVENSSKATLQKLSKDVLQEEGSAYIGKSLEDQVLKKITRKKIMKKMEKEGWDSFLSYGSNKASRQIYITGFSSTKRKLLTVSSNERYNYKLTKFRKKMTAKTASKQEAESAAKKVVKKLTGKEAFDYLKKNEPGAAELIEKIEKRCGNAHHLRRDMYNIEILEGGSTRITAKNRMEHCSVIVKGNSIKGSSSGFKNNGKMNEFFNEHMPNMTYEINDCATYETDELGRVVYAHADRTKMKNSANKISGRNGDTQSKVIEELGGVAGDDGGHLFANNTKGSNSAINQVPMNSKINRKGGDWRKYEELEEKYINANHNVTSKRKLLYKGNNKRPYAIEVTLIVDGKKIEFKPNPITI